MRGPGSESDLTELLVFENSSPHRPGCAGGRRLYPALGVADTPGGVGQLHTTDWPCNGVYAMIQQAGHLLVRDQSRVLASAAPSAKA